MLKFDDSAKRIWTQVRARAWWQCERCGARISLGDQYWAGTIPGSGIEGMVHPDRICEKCHQEVANAS